MQNDIDLNLTDFETILSHQGKIEGFVGSCNAHELMSNLSENLKLSLKNSKGVLIKFEQHSDLPLSITASLLEELLDSTNEDSEVIFGTKEDNTLKEETIKFTIIVTGLV